MYTEQISQNKLHLQGSLLLTTFLVHLHAASVINCAKFDYMSYSKYSDRPIYKGELITSAHSSIIGDENLPF